jgi:phenylalanyl-tRNA synthetase alpha chain
VTTVSLADALAPLDDALAQARSAIANAASLDELAATERAVLGKGSAATAVNEQIKHLDPADRPVAGKALGAYRAEVQTLLDARRAELGAADRADSLVRDRLDLTIGGRDYRRGHMHPVTRAWRDLEDVFIGLGYSIVGGPEVEHDWYNFEALNFPPGHPARAMQDTLYVRLGEPEEVLLRTHTSPVQIRVMLEQPPPIYVVALGRVYRRDTLDARHSPVFHQIEGLVVDHGITLGDLMGTIEAFVQAVFDKPIPARFLPSFFPFTEPSVEFAAGCPFCEGAGCSVCSRTGWIELGGAGMVDPNVFLACGIDPEEYSGFAFGFGIDRIAMLRHDIDHIATLLFDPDVRFLRQL